MDPITSILLIVMLVIIVIIAFKILWLVLPFIIIGAGAIYLYNRFVEPKRKTPHQSHHPHVNPDDDIVDVEFTVRDEDDANN